MSGVGYVEFVANDLKLERDRTEWMAGVDRMYKIASEIPRKFKFTINFLKSGYKDRYRSACRAAEEGDKKTMKKHIKIMNAYHLILNSEPLPKKKIKRVLRYLPGE